MSLSLSLTEAAELLRLHPETLRQRAKSKAIPAAKFGRAWVFIKEDLLAAVRQQYVGDEPCPSTSKKTQASGGSVSAILTTPGYAGRLGLLIEKKRSARKTNSARSSGALRR
jgi:excisionase family DNA binding protein